MDTKDIKSAGISREEHIEYCRRMEDEHHRINRRLELLENSTKQIGSLANSVERLATSMEFMASEQKEQGKKLEKLEERDGEMWRKVVGYIATAILGVIIGFVSNQLGL